MPPFCVKAFLIENIFPRSAEFTADFNELRSRRVENEPLVLSSVQALLTSAAYEN